MYPVTVRNIALISPMRQRFNALSGASSFAEKIIEKYSKTEPFPFSGEALVFLKALGDKLRDEQSIRDDVTYTLRLLIVHRLLVDGKLTDPTVGKNYLNAVEDKIEQNISRLRITDNNAYIRMTDARSYIENSAELGDIILSENINNEDRNFVYSFADTHILNDRFFGSGSNSYAYSGIYNYIPVHDLIYKKEKVGEEAVRIGDFLLPGVSNNVVNVQNAGDTNYSYNNEDLTYKTENNTTENSETISEQSINNYADKSESTSVTNVNEFNTESKNETIVSASDTSIKNETVVNAGDNNYSYNNEDLTYKTENNSAENSETVYEQSVNNFADKSESTSVVNVNASNTENKNETAVSASDTSIKNETVVNAGDTNYSYNNEDLTYNTENNNEQDIQNFANETKSVTNVNESNTEKKNEKTVSVSDTSITNETVVNAGDNNYSYNNEDLTYKTENNTTENSETVYEQSVNNFADKSESTSVTNVNESNTEKKNEKTVSVSDTSITNETVVNAGDNNYSYNNEDLTYKTENNTTENSETISEQSINNFADNSESTSVVNVNASNTENKNETAVPVSDTNITNETVVNAGEINYSYNNENLTYKTENDNEQDIQNFANETKSVTNVNESNTENINETVVSVSDTNITNETVVNAGETNYNYNNEDLIYKTENNTTENSETVYEQSVNNFADNSESTSVTNVNESNTEKKNEKTVSVSDTSITNETVVNAGDNNYSYNNEDLTYKTENNSAENSETVYEQSVNNFADNSGSTSVVNVNASNTENKNETAVSVSDTNITNETVVNAGETNYNYNNEDLIYKTENSVSEQSGSSLAGASASETAHIPETAQPQKVSDLADIGLLVMNSFLSGGSQYLSSVKEKYIHKLRLLSREVTAKAVHDKAAANAGRDSAVSSVSVLNRLLSEKKELTDEERRIYDTAVRNVYLESHESKNDITTEKMLEKLSVTERTKALSQMIGRLMNDSRSGIITAPSANRAAISAENNNNDPETGRNENGPAAERVRSAIVNVLSYINNDKSDISDSETSGAYPSSAEMQLLSFITGKSGSEARKIINDPKTRNALSLQLGQLYFRIADVSVQQKVLLERVKQAAEMPYRAILVPTRERKAKKQSYRDNAAYNVSKNSSYDNDYITINNISVLEKGLPNSENGGAKDSASGGKGEPAEYVQGTEFVLTLHRLTERSGDEYTTINNISVLDKGLPNSEKGSSKSSVKESASAGKGEPAEYVQGTEFVPTLHRLTERSGDEYTTINNISVLDKGLPNSEKGSAKDGESAGHGEHAEYVQGTEFVPTLHRLTERSGDKYTTINNISVLEKGLPNSEKGGAKDSASGGKGEPAEYVQGTEFVPTLHRLTERSDDEYTTINNISVLDKGLPNSEKGNVNGGASGGHGEPEGYVQGTEFVPTLHRLTERSGDEYTTINNISVLDKGLPNSEKGNVNGGASGGHGEPAEYVQGTEFVPTLHRFTDRLNTVNNLLERIAARKGAFETITGVNAKSRENTGYNNDTRRYGPASEGSSGDVYEGAQYSLAFTNEINAYLPAGIAPDHSAIADSITLLPIFGYEKLILPKNKVGVSVSGNKASDRMHAVPTQKHITKNRSINIINKNIMSGISASQDDNAAQENALSSRDMQMIRPEHETVALRYREPAAAAQTADRNMQAMQQPSHADLVKQFGNLIEGADAGLVPSFDVGTHGISEAMAAIEQTAEKVQLNSKLIEEIREKQREIEEVTLKSTDMDAISDEMIRKLRSHLRLDKSRFAQ